MTTSTLAEQLRMDPDPITPGSCDRAFLHLVEAGLVAGDPHDLVTATLRAIQQAAREAAA